MSEYAFQDVMLRDGGAERVLREALRGRSAALTIGLASTSFKTRIGNAPPTVLHRAERPGYRDLPSIIERILERPDFKGDVLAFHHHFGLLARGTGNTSYYLHSPTRSLHEPWRVPWEIEHLSVELRAAMTERESTNIHRAHRVFVNSNGTQARVKAHYGVEPEVLYPPTELWQRTTRKPNRAIPERYVLTVSRLSLSKNLLQSAAAVSVLGVPWVIVGDGDTQIRQELTQHAILMGRMSSDQLGWLIQHASVCFSPAIEDFGLFAAEALTFGKPLVVQAESGIRDLEHIAPITPFEERRGEHEAIQEALEAALLQAPFDPSTVRSRLDPSRFRSRLWGG